MKAEYNHKYKLVVTANNEERKSTVIFLGYTKSGDFLIFQDQEIYYFGNIPMAGIRFLVKEEDFPTFTFKSFGFNISSNFYKS